MEGYPLVCAAANNENDWCSDIPRLVQALLFGLMLSLPTPSSALRLVEQTPWATASEFTNFDFPIRETSATARPTGVDVRNAQWFSAAMLDDYIVPMDDGFFLYLHATKEKHIFLNSARVNQSLFPISAVVLSAWLI